MIAAANVIQDEILTTNYYYSQDNLDFNLTKNISLSSEGLFNPPNLNGYFYIDYYSDSSCSTKPEYSYGIKLNTCISTMIGDIASSVYYTCRVGSPYATMITYNNTQCLREESSYDFISNETYYPRNVCQNFSSNQYVSAKFHCSQNQSFESLPISNASFVQTEYNSEVSSDCDGAITKFSAHTLDHCISNTSVGTSYQYKCVGEQPVKLSYSDALCLSDEKLSLVDSICNKNSFDDILQVTKYSRSKCYSASIDYQLPNSPDTYHVEYYTSMDEDAAVYTDATTSSNFYLIETIYSNVPNTQNFGWSTGITDSYAIVGDPFPNNYQGCAFVYSLQTSKYWTYQQKLVPTVSKGYFGNGVAIYGIIAAIGAPAAYTYSGSVFIYSYSSTTAKWSQQQILRNPKGTSMDLFGFQNAVFYKSGSSSWLTVGAPAYPNGLYQVKAGGVYIYSTTYGSSTWTLSTSLYPYGTSSKTVSGCGFSVAVYGNYAVVGCPWQGAYYSGSFAVYNYVSSWTLVGITTTASMSYGYLGWSSAIYNQNIIVGSSCASEKCVGFAVAYSVTSTAVTYVKKLSSAASSYYSFTGSSVSLNGQYAVVGSPGLTVTLPYQGGTFLWSLTSGSWSYSSVIVGSQSYGYAGYKSSLNAGNQLIIGAFGIASCTGNGAAYLYQLSSSSSPSSIPTETPISLPTVKPSLSQTFSPTTQAPIISPSIVPSYIATTSPSHSPSALPICIPTELPTLQPISYPSKIPSAIPSSSSTVTPTSSPIASSSYVPSPSPSFFAKVFPTENPSSSPSTSNPATNPSTIPTANPSPIPTSTPTSQPPTSGPSCNPTVSQSDYPTAAPSSKPSASSSYLPSYVPSSFPSLTPFASPTSIPNLSPTTNPSSSPTAKSSAAPSFVPTAFPSENPTPPPSSVPSALPTSSPSQVPSSFPTVPPTGVPTSIPSSHPTTNPTVSPSSIPSFLLSSLPSYVPMPSSFPTVPPTEVPTSVPSPYPTTFTTDYPTLSPSSIFIPIFPTPLPSSFPFSTVPSNQPSVVPTFFPTRIPTRPTTKPTTSPKPSASPISKPTLKPTANPTATSSTVPSFVSTSSPSEEPSSEPTQSLFPSVSISSFNAFTGSQIVCDVSTDTWSSSNTTARAFNAALASTMNGIQMTDIIMTSVVRDEWGCSSTHQTSASKLSYMNKRLLLSDTSGVVANYTIKYDFNDLGYSSSTEAFDSLATELRSSVTNGNFTSSLRHFASVYSCNALQNASSTSVSLSDYSTVSFESNAPSSAPTVISVIKNEVSLSVGAMAGIIVSVCFVFIGASCGFYIYYNGKNKQKAIDSWNQYYTNKISKSTSYDNDSNSGNDFDYSHSFKPSESKDDSNDVNYINAINAVNEVKPRIYVSKTDFKFKNKDDIGSNGNIIDHNQVDDFRTKISNGIRRLSSYLMVDNIPGITHEGTTEQRNDHNSIFDNPMSTTRSSSVDKKQISLSSLSSDNYNHENNSSLKQNETLPYPSNLSPKNNRSRSLSSSPKLNQNQPNHSQGNALLFSANDSKETRRLSEFSSSPIRKTHSRPSEAVMINNYNNNYNNNSNNVTSHSRSPSLSPIDQRRLSNISDLSETSPSHTGVPVPMIRKSMIRSKDLDVRNDVDSLLKPSRSSSLSPKRLSIATDQSADLNNIDIDLVSNHGNNGDNVHGHNKRTPSIINISPSNLLFHTSFINSPSSQPPVLLYPGYDKNSNQNQTSATVNNNNNNKQSRRITVTTVNGIQQRNGNDDDVPNNSYNPHISPTEADIKKKSSISPQQSDNEIGIRRSIQTKRNDNEQILTSHEKRISMTSPTRLPFQKPFNNNNINNNNINK
eukprot:gene8167-11053_t